MSCIILSNQRIADLAGLLETQLNAGYNYTGIGTGGDLARAFRACYSISSGAFLREDIARTLHLLNLRAYYGRYPEETYFDDFAGYPAPAITLPPRKNENGLYVIRSQHHYFAKLLHSYLYQISEDAIYQTPINDALEAFSRQLDLFIVQNSPEYAAAPWA